MPQALILGVSSGFGAAAARAYAQAGYDVVGVHLDRRSAQPAVDALVAEVESHGRRARFFNLNAADDERRAEVIAWLAAEGGRVDVLLHSLAFGTLAPLVPVEGRGVTRKQLEMTLDVMANSLVYWTQDLVAAGLLGQGGRVFAMTSSGSHLAWSSYGPVSAAKAALEAYVRQLAVELGGRGVTVNAVLAGVTQTPALAKIPGSDRLVAKSLERNPGGRLTTPEDVAPVLVALSGPAGRWVSGGVIHVDGGEDVAG